MMSSFIIRLRLRVKNVGVQGLRIPLKERLKFLIRSILLLVLELHWCYLGLGRVCLAWVGWFIPQVRASFMLALIVFSRRVSVVEIEGRALQVGTRAALEEDVIRL